jgi:hypothetical protein
MSGKLGSLSMTAHSLENLMFTLICPFLASYIDHPFIAFDESKLRNKLYKTIGMSILDNNGKSGISWFVAIIRANTSSLLAVRVE